MKQILTIIFIGCYTSLGYAHDSKKIISLEQRLSALEEKLAALETASGPAITKATAEQRIQNQRRAAKARMRQDASTYSKKELTEIESLYQVANKNWNSKEGKESLKQLIDKYDKANRTGCALLYLGQMSKGKQRKEYLIKAIEGFSDSYYGDGVQVGPYARFKLAHHYDNTGRKTEAKVLREEIRSQYPDAINHKGRFLSDL